MCNARVASTRALQEKFVSHVIFLAGVLPGAPRTLDWLVDGGENDRMVVTVVAVGKRERAVRRKAGHTSEPEHWFTITADYAQWLNRCLGLSLRLDTLWNESLLLPCSLV